MKDLRFGTFDPEDLCHLMAKRILEADLLSSITCIVGIASNVQKWPENRSFVSVMRVAEQAFVLQLSHFTEVKVVEVTDRHQIPKTLGWIEPTQYGGINFPSWHKLVNRVSLVELSELLRSAFDDLMVTYSHHQDMSEHFYLLTDTGRYTTEEEELIARFSENLHKLEAKEINRLMSAKDRFTNPELSDYLKITADDWDDEIGYLPKFAALTNHRGYPTVLFRVDVHLFGEPENLRIWNGQKFTRSGTLGARICSDVTARRKNFQLVSGHLVQKVWPEALNNQRK
jgi:hypothetical protein